MSNLQNTPTTNDRYAPIVTQLDPMQGDWVVRLAEEYLGRDLDYTTEPAGDGAWSTIIETSNRQPHPLTIPERTAIEVLVKYCAEHAPGLKRSETVSFPRAVNYRSCDRENWDTTLTFTDEARAYQFAGVVERCFVCFAEVAEQREGWEVIVSSKYSDDGITAEELARLQGACLVLLTHEVTPTKSVEASLDVNGDHALTPSPESRQAWHSRHNTQLQRIEDATNAILAALSASQPANQHNDPKRDTKSGKTPAKAVDVFADDSGDAHVRLAKSSGKKKPSKKS